MRTKPKDQRVTIESDPGKESRGPEESKRLADLVEAIELWKDLLEMPPKAELELHIKPEPLEEDAKMEVEWDKDAYHRYTINIGPQALQSDFDHKRRGYVVHELVHILNYPYTSAAEFFAKTEHNKEYLSGLEEQMTCRLDEAFCSVADYFYKLGFVAGRKSKKRR